MAFSTLLINQLGIWYSLVFISPLLLHLLGLNGVRPWPAVGRAATQPLSWPLLLALGSFLKQVGLTSLHCSWLLFSISDCNAVYDFYENDQPIEPKLHFSHLNQTKNCSLITNKRTSVLIIQTF